MSWIDDAKQKAQQEKVNEVKQKEQADIDERIAHQHQVDRAREDFNLYAKDTRSAIEKILAEAKLQGLIVKNPEEGFKSDNRHYNGLFPNREVPTTDREGEYTVRYEAWSVYWTIDTPNTEVHNYPHGDDFKITLYIQLTKGKYSPLIIVDTFMSSHEGDIINVNQLEQKIKDWLHKIYKEK
jgi:hypothetical protein